MTKLSQAFNIIRYNGLGYCAFRVRYALRKRLALLEHRCPLRSWDQLLELYDSERTLQQDRQGGRFFFDKSSVNGLNADFAEDACEQAKGIGHNHFRFFFDQVFDLGDGPDWFKNPNLNTRARADIHWSRTAMFDPNVGDIKWIWEASRFAWAYALVRAYAATNDEKYAEKFWTLFESWCRQNPPNLGPNYACGQECAIRLMAMCFALYGLGNSAGASGSVERCEKLIVAILLHADRIDHNIDYAISTRTNHSLTEAVGLYTAGTLFPEYSLSRRWRQRGKAILVREVLKQIYPDGSYIQHSTNYHRLALQDILWAVRLGRLNDDSFPDEFIRRFKLATDYLYQLQDDSGQVPNYGSNDGALIIPLNSCDYRDFRPVIQACRYALTGEKLFGPGRWDEDLLWLFGRGAAQRSPVSVPRVSSAFASGGYYTLRQHDSWAMIRCHTYRDRPGQADMLHIDLWVRGVNILCDSGTYSYNDPQAMYRHFKSSFTHNCLVVDNIDQMTQATHFQWLDWVKAEALVHRTDEAMQVFIARMPYRKRATHVRAVCALEHDIWIVIDDVLGSGEHEVQCHWQLPSSAEIELSDNLANIRIADLEYQLLLSGNGQISAELLTGGEHNAFGWRSLYYGRMESAWTIRTTQQTPLPLRQITVATPRETTADVSHGQIELHLADGRTFLIRMPEPGRLGRTAHDVPRLSTGS